MTVGELLIRLTNAIQDGSTTHDAVVLMCDDLDVYLDITHDRVTVTDDSPDADDDEVDEQSYYEAEPREAEPSDWDDPCELCGGNGCAQCEGD